MEKLDLKDKKILFLLLENSRLATSQIAKLVRLSKNSVLYRINRLLEKGIIWKFFAAVNYEKLGLYTYDVFVKLKASEEREKQIKEHIRNHPNVIWAGSLFGKWDIFVQFIAKDARDFEGLLDGFIAYLGNDLDVYETKLLVKKLKLDHQLFDFKLNYKFVPVKINYSEIFIPDELDKKILHYLNTVDGLAQYQEIGKAVGASLKTTKNRIDKLIKDGVIHRFFPFVRHKRLGMQQHLVLLTHRHLTKKSETEITNYMQSIPEIHLAFKTVGKPEIYFWVITENETQVEKIIKDFKNKFYNSVLDMDSMLTTEEITLNFFPKGLLGQAGLKKGDL